MTKPEPARQAGRLTIIGGGAAGLASAVWALRGGLEPRVFEAGASLGGNARTFQMGSFRYDSGAHRLHAASAPVTRLLTELGAGRLHAVDAPSRISWRGHSLAFPPRLLDVWRGLGARRGLRALSDLLAARLTRARPGPDASFEAHAVHRYGRSLAQQLLLDYSEKLWGLPCDQLSARIAGGRLRGFDVWGLLRELAGLPARHLDGRFLYPRGGFGRLWEWLAEALGPRRIQLESPVERVCHHQGWVRAIQVAGRQEPVEQVISSLPLPGLLAALEPAPPEELLTLAAGLRFRNLRLLALFLDRPRVGPCASLYFPEPALPWTRIVEPKNRCPSLAPAQQTSLVVELPCWPGDDVWQASEQALRARVVPLLVERGLFHPRELLGCRAHRLSHAYPVLERDTAAKLERLRAWLAGLRNLSSVGRGAGFRYGHVHDWFEQARVVVDRVRQRNT